MNTYDSLGGDDTMILVVNGERRCGGRESSVVFLKGDFDEMFVSYILSGREVYHQSLWLFSQRKLPGYEILYHLMRIWLW